MSDSEPSSYSPSIIDYGPGPVFSSIDYTICGSPVSANRVTSEFYPEAYQRDIILLQFRQRVHACWPQICKQEVHAINRQILHVRRLKTGQLYRTNLILHVQDIGTVLKFFFMCCFRSTSLTYNLARLPASMAFFFTRYHHLLCTVSHSDNVQRTGCSVRVTPECA